MHFHIGLAGLAAAVGLGLASSAGATTITFDDLSNQIVPVPVGYEGLAWTNFFTLDGTDFAPSGYQNGVVSPKNVALNAGGNAASFSSATPFTLEDFYITAAWNDLMTVTVTGFLHGVQQDVTSLLVDTSGPTHSILGWTVDQVAFTSAGGVNHGYSGAGTQFALDNVTLGAATGGVPEPASWALLITGFGAAGASIRRRKALLMSD
jgi:hypothetical protein